MKYIGATVLFQVVQSQPHTDALARLAVQVRDSLPDIIETALEAAGLEDEKFTLDREVIEGDIINYRPEGRRLGVKLVFPFSWSRHHDVLLVNLLRKVQDCLGAIDTVSDLISNESGERIVPITLEFANITYGEVSLGD